MKSRGQKYIDKDGVWRGWYVYLHREKESGEVFYVGMGLGKRAWETEKRNQIWKERVEGLTHGYLVEILQEDLTEKEAENLETMTIQKYGSVGEDSPLTNITMGGKSPMFTLSLDSVNAGPGMGDVIKMMVEAAEKYGVEILQPFERYTFVPLDREEALQCLSGFDEAVESLYLRKDEIVDDLFEHDEMRVSNLANSIDVELNTIYSFTGDFKARRENWESVCSMASEGFQAIRYNYNDFIDDEIEVDSETEALRSFAEEVLAVYSAFVNLIVKPD